MDYVKYFSKAFNTFCKLSCESRTGDLINYNRNLAIDCANGIGTLPLKSFCKAVDKYLEIWCYNDDGLAKKLLNVQCGAEYIKATGARPRGMPLAFEKHASVDGDADRIVYFLSREVPSSGLLDDGERDLDVIDGDKIQILIMMWIREKLIALKLDENCL